MKTTHVATNIQFKKKGSCISLVGPAIGSGANGEGGSLLLKSENEMSMQDKVNMIENLLETNGLSQNMVKSLGSEIDELLTELEGEGDPEVEDDSAEDDADPDGAETEETNGTEETANLNGGLNLALATESESSVNSDNYATTGENITLVKSTEKENKMEDIVIGDVTYTQEEFKKAFGSIEDLVTSNSALKEEKTALETESVELKKSNEAFVEAELKVQEGVALTKAKGFAGIVGEDSVEALAASLLNVEADCPMLKALEAAHDMLLNKGMLEVAGTDLEVVTLSEEDRLAEETKQFNLKKANNPEGLTGQEIYAAVWEESPELKKA